MNPTQLVHAYYKAFNRGDREAMASLLSQNGVHDLNKGDV